MVGPDDEKSECTWPALGAAVMARLDELARISSDPDGLTRLYLSPEHKAAALLVKGWMEQAGMSAVIDAAGSVIGRLAGATPTIGTFIVGSHIDTIRNAGRFDGNLGVVVAIEAVATLAKRGMRLPFAVEVVAFGDEEGVRFPATLTGSRALAGTVDPASLESLDDDGITMRKALIAFGCDPTEIHGLARRHRDTLGYVEVHIEQGPVLEAEGLPVGIVTAIAGASRLQAVVNGTSGHAGTVPMNLRRDALAAAAEMVGTVEHLALATPGVVATVGRLDVRSGAINVIPAEVRFTVDLRSPHDAVRQAAVKALRRELAAIAARRGVDATFSSFYEAAAAPCAPELQGAFGHAIRQQGIRVLTLPSGAGHDGLAMVHLCPIGMLFVRCAGGISHNPAESITTADADVAFRVLRETLRDLGRKVPA